MQTRLVFFFLNSKEKELKARALARPSPEPREPRFIQRPARSWNERKTKLKRGQRVTAPNFPRQRLTLRSIRNPIKKASLQVIHNRF